jgi:hypothetical protein
MEYLIIKELGFGDGINSIIKQFIAPSTCIIQLKKYIKLIEQRVIKYSEGDFCIFYTSHFKDYKYMIMKSHRDYYYRELEKIKTRDKSYEYIIKKGIQLKQERKKLIEILKTNKVNSLPHHKRYNVLLKNDLSINLNHLISRYMCDTTLNTMIHDRDNLSYLLRFRPHGRKLFDTITGNKFKGLSLDKIYKIHDSEKLNN